MCGVFGVLRPGGLTEADEAVLAAVGANLTHRGPNGSAEIRAQGAGLGMHRLSIMDVEGGGQPFWSEDSAIGVLGNGEIYNAAALRAQLQDRGHRFTSGSDIEVVPHLFEEYGAECFSRLRGMFALVVLDSRTNTVLIARDPMGEKPVAICEAQGALCFASEQTALVRGGAVAPRIDSALLPDYLLYGFVPEPDSLIDGVTKLPAGHYLTVDLLTGDRRITRYWDPLDSLSDQPLSLDALVDAVRDAVEIATTSDVPVAVALSGGLDSSLVAALASRSRPDLHAFTIGYEGSGASDESSDAASFAATLGIGHTTVRLATSDVAASFGRICSARDEPIADIAGPGYDAVAHAARANGYPVLMNGQGGDELFWGYQWLRRLAIGARDGHPLRPEAPPRGRQAQATWVWTIAGLRSRAWERRVVEAWQGSDGIPLPLWEAQPGYPWLYRGIRDLLGVDGIEMRPRFWNATGVRDRVGALTTRAVMASYLRVNGLAQMDRLTMHHSVEARTPLVDRHLVELVMSTRLGLDVFGTEPKSVFREIAARVLPADVVARPKRGFTPPVREWLRAIWAEHAGSAASVLIETLPNAAEPVRRHLASPVMRSGQVDQVAFRLLTLGLWIAGLPADSRDR